MLERLIGYGGSSAVYVAQQHTPSRKVAVKVFLPRSTMDAETKREFYRRFLREAEVASQLDHPNILPIYSYGEQDGLPYIIMPYVSGGTLFEYIATHGPLSLQEALWHLEQIASALDYAHGCGCIHCDIKPANILLDGDQRIVLADFGIANVSATSTLKLSGERRFMTETNALMGTPDYISPEQALGQPLDGHSDIYSLGIVLFFLLTAQLPFKADSSIALALMHVHDPPPSLCLWRADVSPLVDEVIQKALAKSGADRYETAGAFSRAFAQAIEIPFDSRSAKQYEARVEGKAKERLFEPVIAAPQPVVQVKKASALPKFSRRVHPPRLLQWGPRFMLVASILLILLVGTTTTATFLLVQRLSLPGNTTKVPGPPSSLTNNLNGANTDKLMDKENWLNINSSYFYDKQQQYHILNKSSGPVVSIYNNHQYQDFQLTVTLTFIRGDDSYGDYYGVVFRSSDDQSHYYLFEVLNEASVQYAFSRSDSNSSLQSLEAGNAPSMHTGAGKSNLLTIKALANSFTFWINGQQVGKAFTDTSKSALTVGYIGLYVEEQNEEVSFSHLYIDAIK